MTYRSAARSFGAVAFASAASLSSSVVGIAVSSLSTADVSSLNVRASLLARMQEPCQGAPRTKHKAFTLSCARHVGDFGAVPWTRARRNTRHSK